MVDRLVAADSRLWLSRSWTTRPRRPGEAAGAYCFVDDAAFDARVRSGGFLEWVRFLDHRYGTPVPEAPPGRDVVLEIDVEGAAQVRSRRSDAVVVLLVAPSREVQAARLRQRGDPEEEVARRTALASREVASGQELADYVLVNDDLDRSVAELAAIVAQERTAGRPSGGQAPDGQAPDTAEHLDG